MTKTDKILRCVDDTGADGELYALDRDKWRELRKVQGNEKGKPFTISETGWVKLPKVFKNHELRIYVKVKKFSRAELEELANELGVSMTSEAFKEWMDTFGDENDLINEKLTE